jgi:hypothetical protein
MPMPTLAHHYIAQLLCLTIILATACSFVNAQDGSEESAGLDTNTVEGERGCNAIIRTACSLGRHSQRKFLNFGLQVVWSLWMPAVQMASMRRLTCWLPSPPLSYYWLTATF